MNFCKYILGVIACTGFFSSQVFAADLPLNFDSSTTEKEIYKELYNGENAQNLYLTIYQSIEGSFENKTLKRLSQQSGFGNEDIESALEGTFTDDFVSKCQIMFNSKTSQSLYQCLNILRENYEYEKKMIIFEENLKGEAVASEIWSDGDLSNSFFDLMVDLNIIEIILFGEGTYKYPFDDMLDDDSSDDDGDSVGGASVGDGEVDENINDDDEGSGEDDSENDFTKFCQDPDELVFEQPIWEPDQNDDNQGGENDYDYANDSSSLGGTFQFPDKHNDCAGGEISLYQGLVCIDPWPCNDVFCINISEVTQDAEAHSSSSSKMVSVRSLITAGTQQLNYLKAHTLTVFKNSNERFTPSVLKFFDRKISLDVMMQSLPTKRIPEKTAFDKDDDAKALYIKLKTKISEKVGLSCEKNGDCKKNTASWTINQQVADGTLQSDAYRYIGLNDEQLKEEIEQIKKTFRQEQRIASTQNVWEELRKSLNTTVLYFESLKSAFLKLKTDGMDIISTEQSGKSCN